MLQQERGRTQGKYLSIVGDGHLSEGMRITNICEYNFHTFLSKLLRSEIELTSHRVLGLPHITIQQGWMHDFAINHCFVEAWSSSCRLRSGREFSIPRLHNAIYDVSEREQVWFSATIEFREYQGRAFDKSDVRHNRPYRLFGSRKAQAMVEDLHEPAIELGHGHVTPVSSERQRTCWNARREETPRFKLRLVAMDNTPSAIVAVQERSSARCALAAVSLCS